MPDLGDAVDAVVEMAQFLSNPGDYINDMVCGWFNASVKQWVVTGKEFFQKGFESFEKLAKSSASILTKSPEEFDGTMWSIIDSINKDFIAVGATLVIIFWCIKLCSDNLDIRQTMRPETMIKECTILVIAEWFVCSSLDIFSALFDLVNMLTKNLGETSFTISNTLPDSLNNYFNGLGVSSNVGIAIGEVFEGMAASGVGGVFLIICTTFGLMIVYHAFVRMFKVMVIAPYGAIAMSTVAGPHSVSHTTISYLKYTLATILEAVTMLLILKLGTAWLLTSDSLELIWGGTVEITGLPTLILWTMLSCVKIFVISGGIKESATITQRVLGS